MARRGLREDRLNAAPRHYDLVYSPLQKSDRPRKHEDVPRQPRRTRPPPKQQEIDFAQESTTSLHHLLQSAATNGKTKHCEEIAKILVGDRGEKPSLQIYNALILSNLSHDQGSAARATELLDDLKEDGLQPDLGTCHAVLKVLAVHVDHLLRSDILDYMSEKWYTLSEDGAHDVVVGLLREGLFEQALRRLDMMRQQDMPIRGWLLDMTIYVLGEAREMPEAYRILRRRFDSGETNISRSLWLFFLEKASSARHHAGTSLVWTTQVKQDYINPSSGICLDVLSTASQAGDAVMATEVFTHLSKRGTAFKHIHYELLISAYLNFSPEPDLKRALSILTIMPLEKLEPTTAETRALYAHIRDSPTLTATALTTLRDLHAQGRKIPIAALNLLIESHVHQNDLPAALKLYKQIHTFVPIAEGAKKSFANIDTFNLLLKGCRIARGGADAEQASFLVSELLALKVKPTALTYDRLILVFMHAAMPHLPSTPTTASLFKTRPSRSEEDSSTPTPADEAKGLRLLDWAHRHFLDMQPLGWMPRIGTLEMLAAALASVGDAKCWDVLQAAENAGEEFAGWGVRGQWARGRLERAWAEGGAGEGSGMDAADAGEAEDAGTGSG